jgi:DNA invertase Pin-like site-specific DNA recombinase
MGSHFGHLLKKHLSTENELVRNILLATLSSLAKLEREKISQRTKAGLERARAKGKVLGRPKFSDGDREKLIAALGTGVSWHAVSKKHLRALGYEPKQRVSTLRAA